MCVAKSVQRKSVSIAGTGRPALAATNKDQSADGAAPLPVSPADSDRVSGHSATRVRHLDGEGGGCARAQLLWLSLFLITDSDSSNSFTDYRLCYSVLLFYHSLHSFLLYSPSLLTLRELHCAVHYLLYFPAYLVDLPAHSSGD